MCRACRAEIVSDLDSSLRNLRTDVIDLYWPHRDDVRARPVGEILETLNEQVQAGKIRYFGCSNWTAQRIREAQDHAAAHGLQGFAGDQMMWSLAVIDRSAIADTTIVGMDDDCDGCTSPADWLRSPTPPRPMASFRRWRRASPAACLPTNKRSTHRRKTKRALSA